MTRMCCICNKVEQGGQWKVCRAMPDGEPVTHGYCPDCYVKVMMEIEEFISEKGMYAPAAASWSPLNGSYSQCV